MIAQPHYIHPTPNARHNRLAPAFKQLGQILSSLITIDKTLVKRRLFGLLRLIVAKDFQDSMPRKQVYPLHGIRKQ